MLLLDKIIRLLFTMFPLILSGVTNMVFTKTKLYKKYKHPIDNYKTCKDGKRIFGDNKTWIGVLSMIIFCMVFQTICGFVCNTMNWNAKNDLYNVYANTIGLNMLFGFLVGFIYMISELPNSFIKRRLNIASGKTDKGLKGLLFFFIDQIDSLIGVMLLLVFISKISWIDYIVYVLGGGLIHITINIGLYLMKVRKNI